MSPQIQKIMAFEKEIKEYEDLRRKYQTLIINKMDREEYIKYNEVLFSTHSCAIEGNSFSVDDTRELKEKGLGMIPAGKTLFEAFEMLDHFKAFEYMMQNTQHPLDENLLKEIITDENHEKPYSDRILSEKLAERGVKISRRTVAKYREAMGIKDASGRKVF